MNLRVWRVIRTRSENLVHGFFTWGAQISTPGDWYDIRQSNATIKRRLKKPRYFPSQRHLEEFMAAAMFEGGDVRGPGGSSKMVQISTADIKDNSNEIANWSSTVRQSLSFMPLKSGTAGRVTYVFQQRKGQRKSGTFIHTNSEELLDQAVQQLIAHTEVLPFSKRRQGVPLVEPFDGVEEAAAVREEKLAWKARFQGAIWGTGAAILTSIATIYGAYITGILGSNPGN